MAAIALMLIVAVPLLLGFALNYEQTEKTAWQSTQTVNLTETLLNSSSPYYSSYNGPNNNQDIVLMELRDDDTTYTYLNPPGYNSISANPSTIPYLGTMTSGLLNLTDSRGQFRINGTTGYIGTVPDTTDLIRIDAHDAYSTLSGSHTVTMYYENGATESITGEWDVYIYRTGPGSYSVATYSAGNLESVYENLAGITIYKYASSWSIAYMDAASINDLIGRKLSWSENNAKYTYLQLTHSNGSIETWINYNAYNPRIIIDVNTVFIEVNGQLITFNDIVSAKYYYNTHGTQTSGISYNVLVQSSSNRLWADPAAGWKIPIGLINGSSDVIAWWANGYSNNSVRMMIELPAGSQTKLTPGEGNAITLNNNAGAITVNGQLLGNYTYLMVQFNQNSTTVSGINNWPSMGVMPIAYNSKTIEQPANDFAAIKIEDDMKVSYRVDAAEIASGNYPVTKDYTFNPNQKFPNTSYNIRFNSVAVYGDSITLAGTQYTVTDGRITVNDQIVPLLHSEIRSIYNDQTLEYDNTINGIALSSTATPAAISFGGEWSLIAYFYGMEKLTEQAMEWRAGGFGFSEQGTLIVALLVDAAVFVGLGFYGRRSGVKVGWLLALCGCAGFVILCMM